MDIDNQNIYGHEEALEVKNKKKNKKDMKLIQDKTEKQDEKIWYWKEEFGMKEENKELFQKNNRR